MDERIFIFLFILLVLVSGCVHETCEEKWECSAWSKCTNGFRTRTCIDINECGTYNNKPKEKETCDYEILTKGVEFRGGMWSEFRVLENGLESIRRYEAVGPVTIGNKKYAGIEMTIKSQNTETIYEWWYPLENLGKPSWERSPEFTVIKILKPVKTVSCWTGEKYTQETYVSSEELGKFILKIITGKSLGSQTYELTDGRRLFVEKYRNNGKEYWFSSEVPFFPVAKIVENRTRIMELLNFGLHGARCNVTETELNHYCK